MQLDNQYHELPTRAGDIVQSSMGACKAFLMTYSGEINRGEAQGRNPGESLIFKG